MKGRCIALVLLLFSNVALGQFQVPDIAKISTHSDGALEFVPNHNQLPDDVLMECYLGGMDRLYFEKGKLTYSFFDDVGVEGLHEAIHKEGTEALKDYTIKAHAYQVRFIESNLPEINGQYPKTTHYNYLRGNDPNKWAGNVPIYEEASYSNLYDGIDLVFYSHNGYLKYDFIVKPEADPNEIIQEYIGLDGLRLEHGHLILENSIKKIEESKPYAYQMLNGRKVEVPCTYVLHDNKLSYAFPEGYDKSKTLIIDPTVIGATLTGTMGSRNFGHTASFDKAGNMYLGGISFGPGYPTNFGSYQQFFGGGFVDIAVCKFNEDGSQLLYATYLGGGDAEYPHSIIVDDNEQLCIFGSTTSFDYPVSLNAYQPFRKSGSDIVITRLNASGSALVGSTYLGGNGVDGLNSSSLNTNYGEAYRGEIILDEAGNILIATCTSSADFPVSPNAFQSTYNSNVTPPFSMNIDQDGVVFKMNSDLSTLFWATYLGGSDADTAFGIRLDDFGNIIVTGTAGHDDFPVTSGAVQNTWPGGEENAYVSILTPNGTGLISSTFWGTSDGDDHSYFVDIDEDRNIHIYGQTTGTMPITPDTYFFNPGSKQYLAAFSFELNTLQYSTVIGLDGNGMFPWEICDFVPVAFMVDKCNGIYFSGYYAEPGLPVTPDAILDSDDTAIYLGVLEPQAKGLKFGTYYGSADHVDGGTSRFDKGGIVYQGVCSCQGRILNTSADAHAQFQTEQCDMGIFKIDFDIKTVTAAASISPSTSGCAPFTVDFNYTGLDGQDLLWDFGDMNTSNLENPTHTFNDPGQYQVMLIAEDLNSCNVRDTAYLVIDVLNGIGITIDTSICAGSQNLFLDASTQNANYQWQNGSTSATLEVNQPGTYWVDISIQGCSRRDSFIIESGAVQELDLGEDVNLCDVPLYLLDAEDSSFQNYVWNAGIQGSFIFINETGTYSVTATDNNGCVVSDTIEVALNTTPLFNLGPDAVLCEGEFMILEAVIENADFEWHDGSTDPTYLVDEGGVYSLTANSNGCIASDEIVVTQSVIDLDVGPDVELCDESSATLTAISPQAESFEWNTFEVTDEIEVIFSGTYWVQVTDQYNCIKTDTVNVNFYESPTFDLGQDTVLCGDESIQLNIAIPGANFEWHDGSEQPNYEVNDPGLYALTVTLGPCSSTDEILVSAPTPMQLNLPDDEAFCDLSNYVLDAIDPYAVSYEWSSGAFESGISVNQTGMYWVELTDSLGCTLRDTISLEFNDSPIFDLGPDTVLCVGDVLLLDATSDDATYLWHDGSMTPDYVAMGPGTYQVTVQNANCSSLDELIISPPSPMQLSLPGAQQLCDVQNFELNANDPFAVDYLWNTGSTDPSLLAETDGIYWVEIMDEFGCLLRDTTELTFGTSPQFSLMDTVLCQGTNWLLDLSNLGTNYLWQDGSQNDQMILDQEGLYWVEIDNAGCITRDSLVLSYAVRPELSLQQNDVSCHGDCTGMISVEANSAVLEYLWDGGSTSSSIENLCADTYYLSYRDQYGCWYQDSSLITQPDPLEFELNFGDVSCAEYQDGWIDLFDAIGGTPPYQYALNNMDWSDETSFDALGGGWHYVTLQDSETCEKIDSIELYEPPGNDIFAGEDQEINLGESTTLEGEVDVLANQSIQWTPALDLSCEDCLEPDAAPLESTWYTLIVTDLQTGCELRDEVLVRVERALDVYVPNVFSPNKDGFNEYFSIFSNASVGQINYLHVYDRWGNLVFERNDFQTNEPEKGWDGTMKGSPLNPGVFAYLAEIRFVDGSTEIFKGDITLMR